MAKRRAALSEVLERGIERCDLRADLDLELALDVLGGPLFYRLLITGGPIDDALAEGVVDLIMRASRRQDSAAQPRSPKEMHDEDPRLPGRHGRPPPELARRGRPRQAPPA
jgi:hypothetical protein